MSTRSNIARLDPETGRITSIYCHCDGYPNGVGAKLKYYYNTDTAAVALLALGNLSVLETRLAPEPGEAHSFGASVNDVTVAYTRDRGDAWEHEKPIVHASKAQWLADCLANFGYEHLYLFENGGWRHVDAEQARQILATINPSPFRSRVA
jgi:hypothetical protein